MGTNAMPMLLIRWGQNSGGARFLRYLWQDQRLRLSWTAATHFRRYGSPPSRSLRRGRPSPHH